MESQGSLKKVPPLGTGKATSARNPSHDNTSREGARKRGPSLVAKAKELLLNQARPDTKGESSSSSFRRPPGQPSQYADSALGDEKARLSIEAETPCFNLVQRWKDPTDWLEPSDYWKRTHPAMNFCLWKIIARNGGRELKGEARRNLEEAVRLYERNGGDVREGWKKDGVAEEEVLDSWSLSFGGHDPPRCRWNVEE